MAVTALAWNLEEFGARYGLEATGRQCEIIRCGLAAAVVADLGAQVLVIQELRVQGIPFLARLQTFLNATGNNDWHFDWIPGAIAGAGAMPPAVIGDLGFTGEGNLEGYAVLYRNGYARQQAGGRSAGQDTVATAGGGGANRIDLVLDGPPIQFNANNPVITFNALGGATALGFPTSTCPDANIVRNLRGGRVFRSNDVIPQQRRSRRPCQISIVDPNANPQTPVSTVVYHAPVGQNNSKSPIYGALLGFAAGALGANAGARGYLGDFNVVVNGDLTVLRNRATALNFVAQTYANNAFANTSVHSAVGTNGPWHQGAGVLTSPRDIGLGTTANATSVPDVLGLFTQNGTRAYKMLRLQTVRNFITNTLLPRVGHWFPNNAGTVVTEFYSGGPYTIGDVATGRALMFNLLLSDHLPVQIVQN
ncbi:hypothetical protein BRAO375_2460018 [Bradyrhizobium sp. ORS 375]|uniref:hypothetical protein n=1 Tax=Bradyrhizobium sp. (strain ORS 375) TaxID=566679 RepID=UPI0002408014|nr:hypothetical protein [Bradyrhizobium sp. ORS 375]CCD93197.1 hypothetical protein BRAO375_2460018 [Bradyrhizobium sp. ORS 375]